MQLALAVGGAIIGSAFGAPQIGWAIGSMLGSYLTKKDQPDTQVFGPRLTDLKVQTSSFGVPIPRVYGVMRVAGNVIWAPPIVETVTTEVIHSGGKGFDEGPSQTSTTYSYSASFAVGLCEGEIVGIRKVWANGKLIYNIGDDASLEAIIGSTDTMTVYLGTETQTADPTIVAQEGTGNVPGFRGLAYVVFSDLQLAEYGNRLPNLEFEVVQTGAYSDDLVLKVLYTLPGSAHWEDDTDVNNHYHIMTPGARYLWAVQFVSGFHQRLMRFDNYTGTLVDSRDLGQNINIWGVGQDGRVYYGGATDGTLNSLTYEGRTGSVGLASPMIASRIDRMVEDPTSYDDEGEAQYVWGEYDNIFALRELRRVSVGGGTWSNFRALDATFSWLAENPAGIAGRIYCYCTDIPTIPGGSVLGYWDTETLNFTTIRTYTDLNDLRPFVGRDGYIYCRSGNAGQQNILERMTPDGTIVDSVTLPGVATSFDSQDSYIQDAHGYLYLIIYNASQPMFRISYGTMDVQATEVAAVTGTFNHRFMMPDTYEGSRPLMTWAHPDTANNNVVNYVDIARLSADTIPLSDVVTDICGLVDLEPADINVSALAAIPVTGYVVSRRTSARAMIEPLMTVYQFDAVESDGKLKFVVRGGSSAVTIPEEDLGARQDGMEQAVELLSENRRHELDMPRAVDVNYIDQAFDYQPVSQSDRRLTTDSQQQITLNVPVVLSSDQALAVASKNLYSAWLERNQYEFSTSRKYLAIEPTDVITVEAGNVDHVLRVLRRDDGANGIMKWTAVLDDSDVYDQEGEGVDMEGGTSDIAIVGPSTGVLMDIPLLQEQQDHSGLYATAAGYSDGWRGTQFFKSIDSGSTYDPVPNGVLLSGGTVGYTTSVLDDYPNDETNERFDESSTVTVVLENGSLESVTRERLLSSDDNVAMIGGEIVQFRDATLVATDTYDLSGLIRGRLGSEEFMVDHVSGERFVLLTSSTLLNFSEQLALSNVLQRYKPMSIGSSLDATTWIQFANSNRRLKPLAPVRVGGGRNTDGDWLMTWSRRTRYPAGWADSVDAPLGEDAERYEVDILDLSDEVIATITATEQSAEYLAADQVADAGETFAGSFIVYQMSADVGRGYPSAAASVANHLWVARYWRFIDFDPPTGPAGDGIQFSEIILLDATGTNITSQASFSGTTPTSGTINDLIDNNVTTDAYWDETISPTTYFQFDFGSPPGQVSYILLGAHFSSHWPGDFKLQNSNDGVTWNTVTRIVSSFPGFNSFTQIEVE